MDLEDESFLAPDRIKVQGTREHLREDTMAAPSNIPAVSAKNAALSNDVALDVKALNIEDGEIAKSLSQYPSQAGAGVLSARRGAIASALKKHD